MSRFYEKALDHFIDISTEDATSILAKEKALIGLSLLIECYEQHSIPYDDLSLVALPDFTFTRNNLRWQNGFAYGCVVFLPKNGTPLIPIGFRPNCCGVILSKINEWDGDDKSFSEKFKDVVGSHDFINPNDFNRRNHFLSILKEENSQNYFALLHGSFSKIKSDQKNLPGLYIEKSDYWKEKVSQVQVGTNGYSFPYLISDSANEYYELYQKQEALSLKYREVIFNDLFDYHEVLFHEIHEGLFNKSTILLGAYASTTPFVCPLMVSPQTEVTMVKINQNLSALTKNRISEPLYISPHGAGYELHGVKKAANHNSEYILQFNNDATMRTNNILDLPFCYRKNVVEEWCVTKQAGEKKTSLIPIFSTKL